MVCAYRARAIGKVCLQVPARIDLLPIEDLEQNQMQVQRVGDRLKVDDVPLLHGVHLRSLHKLRVLLGLIPVDVVEQHHS